MAIAVENNFSCPSKLSLLSWPILRNRRRIFLPRFLQSIRIWMPQGTGPPVIPQAGYTMALVRIRQNEFRTLRSLGVNKATGPDAIVLRNCAPQLSPVLIRLYRLSLQSDVVARSLKFANVQPVPKKKKQQTLSTL